MICIVGLLLSLVLSAFWFCVLGSPDARFWIPPDARTNGDTRTLLHFLSQISCQRVTICMCIVLDGHNIILNIVSMIFSEAKYIYLSYLHVYLKILVLKSCNAPKRQYIRYLIQSNVAAPLKSTLFRNDHCVNRRSLPSGILQYFSCSHHHPFLETSTLPFLGEQHSLLS